MGLEQEERKEEGVPGVMKSEVWFLAGEEGRRPRACEPVRCGSHWPCVVISMRYKWMK